MTLSEITLFAYECAAITAQNHDAQVNVAPGDMLAIVEELRALRDLQRATTMFRESDFTACGSSTADNLYAALDAADALTIPR